MRRLAEGVPPHRHALRETGCSFSRDVSACNDSAISQTTVFRQSLGYYNTAFHHGTWFQTAVGRPFFLDFEDGGGIIAAHNVGASIHGAIPSGKWGLGYIFEVGNGRSYVPPGQEENLVLNVKDDNDYKAFNLAFISKPDWLSGLQFGAGLYSDTLSPSTLPR